MNALHGRRVAVIGGDGLVGRSEHGLLVVHGHPDAVDALLADRPLDTAAGVEELRRTAVAGLPDGIAGLVVVTAATDELVATAAGPEHVGVDGAEPPAERDGHARVHRIPAEGEVRLGLAVGRVGAAHDLRDGLVPGAGLALAAASRPAAGAVAGPAEGTRTLTAAYDLTQRAAQQLEDAPDPPAPAGATDQTAVLEAGTTLTVEASGDDGGPDATPPPEPVEDVDDAPAPVGFIVFDDGTTVAVDRPYVIGRQPPDTGDAPLVVDDPDHTVSRIHARLRPDGGRVLISDAGSSNGTHLWDRAASAWRRLMPGDQTVLPPETYVAVGRRVFVHVTEAPAE